MKTVKTCWKEILKYLSGTIVLTTGIIAALFLWNHLKQWAVLNFDVMNLLTVLITILVPLIVGAVSGLIKGYKF